MASVLLCEDERLGRQVAVKRLHADSPVDVEQRFKREAKLGASLNHPNLVSVFDTATDEEGVLIVMEYVDGDPLSRLLRRGPLPPEQVRQMVVDLAEALDHAHAHGIVHRDVKPGNVLIREDGVTKLADLGIAIASDGTQITRSGVVLGTAAYMAPEQLEGRGAGPPADVYALAAIAFEALSGRRAREGRTPMEIAHSMATEDPPDLRDEWPEAPAAVARVLQRGMALEPENRPESAGELARELSDALQGDPDRTAPTRRFTRQAPVLAPLPADADAAPTGGGEPPSTAAPVRSRQSRRRPSGAAIALALVFIALAIATIAGALLSGGDDGSSPAGDSTPAKPANKKDKAQKEPEPKQQPEAQQPAEPAPAPEEEQAPSGASGAELNQQGFDLMNQGRYDEAIPVLQRAVQSFPAGTSDLNYAYALFNLGKSLRLAGRYDEAVSILKQRLKIPNQTETVRQELELAKQQAKGK